MEQALIEAASQIILTLVVTLLGVAGTWVLRKLNQSEHLKNIAAAVQQVIEAAQLTAAELEQTLVKTYKAGNGGKLSADQIAVLQTTLLNKTAEKLSKSVIELLEAAQTDVNALITGAAEQWIGALKQEGV
jgi:hypothetical protein